MNTVKRFKQSMSVCLMALAFAASAAQADSNVAVGKTATASQIGYDLPPANAIDGNSTTRWSSGGSTEAWISVDLEYYYNLTHVILSWEGAYSKGYDIELSNDNENWTSVYSTSIGSGGIVDIDVSGSGFGKARYARMRSSEPYNSKWGVSLWEFEVYGDRDSAPCVTVAPEFTIVKLPENLVTIDATVDDIDSTSFTYKWSQVSGPAMVAFNGTDTQEDAQITFPSARGDYEFKIIVKDEANNASFPAYTSVKLLDSAIDDKLIAHLPFDEGTGTVAHDITSFDDFGVLGHHEEEGGATHADPNWTAGWIPGSNNYALDFTDLGYVEITPDTEAGTEDPNLMNLEYGITVACWVNANDWEGNRRLVQYGLGTNDSQNIFRLLYENNALRFIPDYMASGHTQRQVTAPIFSTGKWHHVAGTYDGKVANLYVDGALVGTKEYDTYQALYPYEGQTVSIGCKHKDVAERYLGDYMYGKLDDVRIYSYPLSLDSVRDLAALGQNAAPTINEITAAGVGDDNVIMLTGATTIDMDSDVFDVNNDVISYAWTQVAPETTLAQFSAVDVKDPQITFSEVGTYTFRLNINDGTFGLDDEIYKEITITVNQANCERVRNDGLLLVGDINEDCHVDIYDFALIAFDWLKCNDPEDVTCVNPYE